MKLKFHIVRIKETLEDILYIYNLSKDELVEQNKHIRVWDKLIPGTKLKIPPITNAVDLEVSDIEPFVEDYYPSLNEVINDNDFLKSDNNEKEVVESITNEITDDAPISSKIYEDYEKSSKDVEKQLQKKQEKQTLEDDEEEDERPNHFSNMKEKPVFSNYYPYYYGIYNTPRYIPIPIIYYPVYYPKKPN